VTVTVLPTADAVADAAGARVAAALAAPAPVLALPTGRTPLGLYRRLRSAGLDWHSARTFNLDEFAGLGPDHPGSFRRYMDDELFGPIGLHPTQIGFLRGDARDLAAECGRYEAAIAAAGGVDVLICGVGANGHVGFNEPGPTLVADTHVATLHETTRRANAGRFGGDLQRVPTSALTMGMGTILRARRILVLATGPAKAAAVQALRDGPLTTMVPASWLQVHGAVEVLLDAAAAAALQDGRDAGR
jgi:glucosamine-6-phosphate deaminase